MKTGCLICFEVKRLYGQLLPKLIVCIFSYSNVHLYRTNPMQNCGLFIPLLLRHFLIVRIDK